MAIDFPNSPTNGDLHTEGFKTWQFDGTSWNLILGPTSIPSDSVGTTQLSDNAVTTAKLNNDSVTLDKMASGSAGNIVMYNSSGNPVSASVSGDISIDGSGVTSIASGSIVNSDLSASAAIDSTKITGWDNDQVILGNQIFG